MRKFGNWSVTEGGIERDSPKYYIHKETLTEEGVGDREGTYDWLVHLAEKTWMTEKEINDLNEAFKYAADYFGIELSEEIYAKTLKLQRMNM